MTVMMIVDFPKRESIPNTNHARTQGLRTEGNKTAPAYPRRLKKAKNAPTLNMTGSGC